MKTMSHALTEAARKEKRGSYRYIGRGKENPCESYGSDEMTQRREAARRGSAMLLERIEAVHGRRAA